MEAEDTVMRDMQEAQIILDTTKHCQTHGYNQYRIKRAVTDARRLAQAKISFKVGKTEGVAESLLPALEAIEKSRKAGIREVAEWFMGNYPEVCDSHLESKLKEWGL